MPGMDGTRDMDFHDGIDWGRFQAAVGFDFEDATPVGIVRAMGHELDHAPVDGVVARADGPALIRRHRDVSGAVILHSRGHVTFGFDGTPLRHAGLAYLPLGVPGWAGAIFPVGGLARPGMAQPDDQRPQERVMFRPTEYSQLYDGPPLPEIREADVGSFGNLHLVLLLADVRVAPSDGSYSELFGDSVRPVDVRAGVAAAQRHVNISTGLVFWVLELEFADGVRLSACAPDPGPAGGGEPFPVGSVVTAVAVLTGRFERAERRNQADDVANVFGPGDTPVVEDATVRKLGPGAAIIADAAACLGCVAEEEVGLLEPLFAATSAEWLSEETGVYNSDGDIVEFCPHVARMGADGVGFCRLLPWRQWIGFVGRVDDLGCPVNGVEQVHVAATDCMVGPDPAMMRQWWGLNPDPEAPSGSTPQDPDGPAFGHVDDDGRMVSLDRYGERVKVVGVLREPRTWTPPVVGDARAAHPVATLRLGERDAVIHFPAEAAEVIVDGAVIHGYVTVCSMDIQGLSLHARGGRRPEPGELGPWTATAPDGSSVPRSSRGDEMVLMALRGGHRRHRARDGRCLRGLHSHDVHGAGARRERAEHPGHHRVPGGR